MAAGIFEATGPQALGVGNPAAPNSNFAAADYNFPVGGLIWSADGRFVCGREHYYKDSYSSQIFSVVDLARTTSAASPARLMSYTCAGAVSPSHLKATVMIRHYTVGHALTADGTARWTCDGRTVASVGSAGSPCRYIAFSGNDGRLACFSQDVSRLTPSEALTHVTGWLQPTVQPPLDSQSQILYTQYQIPLATLQSAQKLPPGDVDLKLTGQFSGEHQVYETKCLQSYPLDFDAAHSRCSQRKGNKPTNYTVCSDTQTTIRKFTKDKSKVVYDVSTDSAGAPVANTQ